MLRADIRDGIAISATINDPVRPLRRCREWHKAMPHTEIPSIFGPAPLEAHQIQCSEPVLAAP
jgi:hypothetical protein